MVSSYYLFPFEVEVSWLLEVWTIVLVSGGPRVQNSFPHSVSEIEIKIDLKYNVSLKLEIPQSTLISI